MQENSGRNFRFDASASLLLILAVLPVVCVGQNSASDSQISISRAAPFAGCYELRLGRWWPWGMGEDTKFATPPRRVELRLEHGTDGFERNGLVIRSIPAMEPSRRKAYWQPQGSDGVDLNWTDGFTGVTLRLTKNGKELRGWAHPHFDSGELIPHTAYVTASPIVCAPMP